MHCHELELLLRKYTRAETKEDRYIKTTLENIAALSDLCDQEERYYSDMIIRHFCSVIDMLEKQHTKALAVETRPISGEDSVQFRDGYELVCAFYNHFKKPEEWDYAEIRGALYESQNVRVNPTLKDYAARIQTFAGKYLGEMFRPQEVGDRDPVLFTYENLELILATFKTRDEQGRIVRQRVNIRSALRKLNEFKRAQSEKR